MTQRVVIVGAGHAAGQVVATLKQREFGGKIILIGEEPYYPYQRPPLSKKFLAGEMPAERLYLKPASFYEDPRIDVRLGTRIDSIDREAHTVTTADGDSVAYDKLVLAVGSRVRRLPVPGSELQGVHYLRSIADVEQIRASIAKAHRVTIVGAGYIGLEVAAVCRQRGLDVTVLEMEERVLSRVVSPNVADFFQLEHANQGVHLRLSTKLVAFHGRSRLKSVEAEGEHSIPADCAVIGAGIIPNTEIAAAANLPVDNGIVVDDHCQTADSDIYAVGDCTAHPNSIYERLVRLESVHNALEQAKTAANNICGIDTRYAQVPWFWSDQYDLKLQIAGLSQGYDDVVVRGNPADRSFACIYLKAGAVIAIDAINAPKDFMQAKALIAERAVCDVAALADASVELRDLRR